MTISENGICPLKLQSSETQSLNIEIVNKTTGSIKSLFGMVGAIVGLKYGIFGYSLFLATQRMALLFFEKLRFICLFISITIWGIFGVLIRYVI